MRLMILILARELDFGDLSGIHLTRQEFISTVQKGYSWILLQVMIYDFVYRLVVKITNNFNIGIIRPRCHCYVVL